jgi:hypothetical protein
MCRLSRNSGASTSLNPKGLFRPVAAKFYLLLLRSLYVEDRFIFARPLCYAQVTYVVISETLCSSRNTFKQIWNNGTEKGKYVIMVQNMKAVNACYYVQDEWSLWGKQWRPLRLHTKVMRCDISLPWSKVMTARLDADLLHSRIFTARGNMNLVRIFCFDFQQVLRPVSVVKEPREVIARL